MIMIPYNFVLWNVTHITKKKHTVGNPLIGPRPDYHFMGKKANKIENGPKPDYRVNYSTVGNPLIGLGRYNFIGKTG